MTENKEHLEHLRQYITHRMRKLANDKRKLEFEFEHLSAYRQFLDSLIKGKEENDNE